MKFCKRCGSMVFDEDSFCPTCIVVATSQSAMRKKLWTTGDDSWWVGTLMGFAFACLIAYAWLCL